MNIADVSVRYGVDQKTAAFHIETDTEDTSVSDHYVLLHIPTSVSAAKTGVTVKAGSKVEVETRFSDDLPYLGAEVNVTAGASSDAVSVKATAEDGTVYEATGTTGTPITLQLMLPGREMVAPHNSTLPPTEVTEPVA